MAYEMLLVRPGRVLLRGVPPAMQHDGGARGDVFRVRDGHEAALLRGCGRRDGEAKECALEEGARLGRVDEVVGLRVRSGYV